MSVRDGMHADAVRSRTLRSTSRWPRLIVGGVVTCLGLVLVVWAERTHGFASDLLLEIGATLLLVIPLLVIEWLITKRFDVLQTEIDVLRLQTSAMARAYERARATYAPGPEREEAMREVFKLAEVAGTRQLA